MALDRQDSRKKVVIDAIVTGANDGRTGRAIVRLCLLVVPSHMSRLVCAISSCPGASTAERRSKGGGKEA